MYKLCLLVACLACAGHGRRARVTPDGYFNSQDAKGQKLVEMNTIAGPRLRGRANHPGSGQLTKSAANAWKVLPILLTFLNPTDGFAIGNTRTTISNNSIGTNAGPRVMMTDQNYAEEALTEFSGPTVRAVVSVDWEGTDLLNDNLRAFENFREVHPDVPLTHFLNAAYFTKSGVRSIQEWSPYQALSPIDERGLHVHGWKSLVESSGVEYRSEPDVVERPERRLFRNAKIFEKGELEKGFKRLFLPKETRANKELEKRLGRDVGELVDIRAYTVDELQAIISNSKAILEKQGLKVGKSFRAGAWLAGPKVLEAIRREGFLVNSSAVDGNKMIEQDFWKDKPLCSMLRELWPGITKESQPFLLETPVGWILEMPDTGLLADYTTVEDMVDHIDNAVQQLESEDRFVHIGFHQETAAEYAPRVIAAIKEIKRKHGHRVVFETLEASAQRAMSTRPVPKLESGT